MPAHTNTRSTHNSNKTPTGRNTLQGVVFHHINGLLGSGSISVVVRGGRLLGVLHDAEMGKTRREEIWDMNCQFYFLVFWSVVMFRISSVFWSDCDTNFPESTGNSHLSRHVFWIASRWWRVYWIVPREPEHINTRQDHGDERTYMRTSSHTDTDTDTHTHTHTHTRSHPHAAQVCDWNGSHQDTRSVHHRKTQDTVLPHDVERLHSSVRFIDRDKFGGQILSVLHEQQIRHAGLG